MSIKVDVKNYCNFIDKEMAYITRAESQLSGTDLNYIHEITFLRVFRGYEELIEDIFISSLCRNEKLNSGKLNPWIKAQNSDHALELLKLEKEYVDWDSPNTIIKRAEIIFMNPAPIKNFITAKQEKLLEAKKIRNYIAHNSQKAEKEFNKVYSMYFGALPISHIDAGEFLKTCKPAHTPPVSFTMYYSTILKEISSII
jgi:hypothetical protein